MTISESGIVFIKHQESCRLNAYRDIGGVWTIGWGSTGNVHAGDTLTQEQADALFLQDLQPIVAALNKWLTWPTVRQCEFDAFCSFTFNLGIGALESSTVLKRYNYQGPVGDTSEAFLWWDEVNGKPDEAILERRKREQSMFLGNPAPYNPVS